MNKKLVLATALAFGIVGLMLTQVSVKAQDAATNSDNSAMAADNAAAPANVADNAAANAAQ